MMSDISCMCPFIMEQEKKLRQLNKNDDQTGNLLLSNWLGGGKKPSRLLSLAKHLSAFNETSLFLQLILLLLAALSKQGNVICFSPRRFMRNIARCLFVKIRFLPASSIGERRNLSREMLHVMCLTLFVGSDYRSNEIMGKSFGHGNRE